MNLIYFMADIKPLFVVFVYTLTDVVIKVTVANFLATLLADVIANIVWDSNSTCI